MSVQFIVAHAGRQHSHQLARGLHEQGLLQQYWTGLPASRDRGLGRWLARVQPRSAYPEVDVPDEKVRVQLLTSALRRAGVESWADRAGDALYARWLRRAPPNLAGVVAYENGALRTLRAARARGLLAVLDAAALHHDTAAAWLGSAGGAANAESLRQHKRAEIESADHVLVLSELARDSYHRAGVSPEKISVIRPGYDPAIFRPTPGPRPGTEATFVFAGHNAYLKGLDLLLDALARLQERGLKFRLLLVGAGAPAGPIALRPALMECGKLSQAEFAECLAQAHCLVLPSRCDSFGLVALESLAVGTPVIVSDHAGAHELIEDGVNGWCLPAGDAAALATRLRECCRDPAALLAMRAAASASARPWTWARYRERVAERLRTLVARA